MHPFDQIAALYKRYPQPRTFEEDLTAHISTGYVHITPDTFLMGRGINRQAPPDLIANPWHTFPIDQQDTWLVFAYSGYSRNFLAFLPYPLKWVAWQRRGRPLRFHELSKIQAKCASTTHTPIRCSQR